MVVITAVGKQWRVPTGPQTYPPVSTMTANYSTVKGTTKALGHVVCGGVRYTLLAGGVLDSHRPKSSIRHGAAGDDDEEGQ